MSDLVVVAYADKAAADIGVDDRFAKDLGERLQPGTSAVLALVRRSTPDKVLPELQQYGGQVLQTSLPHDAEERLRTALAQGQQRAGQSRRAGRAGGRFLATTGRGGRPPLCRHQEGIVSDAPDFVAVARSPHPARVMTAWSQPAKVAAAAGSAPPSGGEGRGS